MILSKAVKSPLGAVILFVAVMVIGAYVSASAAVANGLWNNSKRTLSFYNTHTRETLDVNYWESGRYVAAAHDKINWALRDHRAHSDTDISRNLLNLLHDVKLTLEGRHPDREIVFHVISGYRSPKTNNMLRANGGGQATKSRHMHGDAIDIRVPGVTSREVRDIAWCLQRGGVGYYSGSDFVHVDTHDVRFWNWNPKNIDCEQPGV